jgi:flagellar biosynthesis protein FlhF
MNARRFIAKTSRDALAAVRHAFGDDAVVLSTKPAADGVEVLAMGGDSILQIEKMAANAPRTTVGPAPTGKPEPRREGFATTAASDDAETLSMSTLSFQDYVRERMLKRRQEALRDEGPASRQGPVSVMPSPAERSVLEQRMASAMPAAASAPARPAPTIDELTARPAAPAMPAVPAAPAVDHAAIAAAKREQEAMMSELRQVKGLIEERFGALAFMEKLQRQPGQALATQKLLDAGFSPALVRKLVESLPHDAADPLAWATGVLERNLICGDGEAPIEDCSGVYALIGPTGVGKTTSTAKIAAAFAARHGASHLGLITLDAYRVAAHEQLRAYGRILGVPVHTAHDRASLEDLLDLLAAKRMVLIDTAGMAQRDQRTAELLEMLSHRSIRKLLVLNASSQGETIEDVVQSYRGAACHGAVISKLDEAVKLAPALDAAIRHKLRVIGVANGQRVPEDWHRVSASALVQRALRATPSPVHRLEPAEVSLVFTASARSVARSAFSA